LKTHIRHVDGHTFVARSDSNHWIPFDTGTASGGTAAANDPVQLLTIACGGCVSIDVVNHLKKSRKDFTSFEMELDINRAETTPKIIRGLCFHVLVSGEDISEDLVHRAIELSLTKYCSVSLSLDRSVRFRARITLNGQRGETWDIPRDPSLY
jgi:putative redox protein